MAKFFISYSRSVKDEVQQVIDLLKASGHEVWWDGDIPVMADWWATILDKIEWCEVFIFVASEQSVKSAYCLTELKYASDRQRPIVPFMLEDPDRLKLPAELPPRGQWLRYGGDPTAMLQQINTACEGINWQQHQDIRVRRPPEPLTGGKSVAQQFQLARRLANSKKFEEAKIGFTNIKRLDFNEWGAECDEWLARLNSYIPIMELVDDEATLARARTEWGRHVRIHGREFDPHSIDPKVRQAPTVNIKNIKPPSSTVVTVVGVFVVLFVIVLIMVLNGQGQGDSLTTGTDSTSTAVAQLPSSDTPTDTVMPTVTETPLPTNTDTAIPTITETPTPTQELPIADVVATLDAQATEAQATANAVSTAAARATAYAQATQDIIDATATATLWTNTPTPNITASIEAYRTEQAQTATQAWVDSWTPTPTNTHTPTNTFTPTVTPTPNATATLIAFRPQTNADWTPVERDFDGVTMVLVPAGCFDMGDNGEGGRQCFDEPFWIDKYEVTQRQFVRLGGEKANTNAFSGDQHPIEVITWFEALDFCALRAGRLPTEAEWEYAARGPDNLIYPWGDEFVASNTVYGSSRTAIVGSRRRGTSWVGALDMSGNVQEWTSSLYASYPYVVDDGRESDLGSGTEIRRVLRGGTWNNFDNEFLRASVRHIFDPAGRDFLKGFRCARDYD